MRSYLMCDKCGFKYDEISVRKCPHQSVKIITASIYACVAAENANSVSF